MTTPATIIRQLAIDAGLVSGASGALWPSYIATVPDSASVASDLVSFFDTAPVIQTRTQDGQVYERSGLQVRVRAASYQAGYAKAQVLGAAFTDVLDRSVTVDITQYLVHNISPTSGILPVGMDAEHRWFHFTANFLLTINGE